jgi:hypothetical protein
MEQKSAIQYNSADLTKHCAALRIAIPIRLDSLTSMTKILYGPDYVGGPVIGFGVTVDITAEASMAAASRPVAIANRA